jgi:peptidoglycan/xylan/chitin deacetylase (PgdA/CDA1 family)
MVGDTRVGESAGLCDEREIGGCHVQDRVSWSVMSRTSIARRCSTAAALVTLGVLAPATSAQQPPPIHRWTLPDIVATVNKIRAGRDLTPKRWPGGDRVAVALSFDLDAETLFLRSGQLSPQPLSRGEYGARAGTPRILALLDRQRIPASFFIPTVAAQLHPEAVDAILTSPLKHEIGVHGWVHEVLSSLTGDEERELTRRALDFWTSRLGRKPAGIRCPSWDFTKDTLSLIREFGFLYDSSLMGDDRPYEIVAEGKPTGIIELPVEWILDDFAYYSYDRPNYAYLRMSDEAVYEVYKAEFDKAYEEGTMFLLTMHPQITGHRSRIVVLERLIAYMKSKPGVWFATHEQVARAAAGQLPAVR